MISLFRAMVGVGGLAVGTREPRQPLLKPHFIVMALVFAGALVIGYLVLPGDNERIAALQRDGKYREALDVLERRFERGDRSPRTVFQMQRLYEHFGELDKARRKLEMLAALRPRDAAIQRQLAQFHKLTQDEPRYIASLEQQLAARYSEPACKELIGIHRRNGNFASEQAAIGSCRRSGYRRPDDIIRLAYLVATDGDLVQASALLRSVDDRRRLKVDRDRLMLFTALIEAGQAEEAQRRAQRWLKGSRDDVLALLLIDNLALENRQDLAIDLAREVGTPGDSVSLAVAELMLDRDQAVAARAYLKGWLEATRVKDGDVVERFIAAALDAEDPELAFQGAERFGLKRVGQRDLVALAEALSAIGRIAMFKLVQAEIDPTTLRENPLLAAAIEVDRGAPGPARQLLSQVEVDGLDEWRLALWARLMESTGRRALSAQTLRDFGVEPQQQQQPVAAQPPRIPRRFTPPVGARPGVRNTARKKGPVGQPSQAAQQGQKGVPGKAPRPQQPNSGG